MRVQVWLCSPCCDKYKDRNYCPTCGVTYDSEDNSVEAVGCAACEFWVHAKCEGMTRVRAFPPSVAAVLLVLGVLGCRGGFPPVVLLFFFCFRFVARSACCGVAILGVISAAEASTCRGPLLLLLKLSGTPWLPIFLQHSSLMLRVFLF